MAISLRNSITKDNQTCVLWDKKVYDAHEYKLTNKNLLVLLNQDLIKQNLANPKIKPIKFSRGVILKHEGNTIGVLVDPSESLSKYKKEMNLSWSKYVWGTVGPILGVGGIPVAATLLLYFRFKDKKKIQHMLLFEAVEKLKAKTIEKFLNGETLD